MNESIKGKVIKVGNSQGIRIPKLLLEQTGIQENIEIKDSRLIIKAAAKSRVGWAEAFAEMSNNQDDVLLDVLIPTIWDEEEWVW